MINDKSVIVVGGSGSFGQKFVETALRDYRPKRLVVFSRGEFAQFEMQQKWPDDGCRPIRYFIGDVRDRDRLMRAFKGIDIVVHAAALKQVPACEYNPLEAVKTNIMGAANVIDAALDSGVQKVIALSSDKSTSPVNLYGATKLAAEKLFVEANAYRGEGGTRFSCVRYGNVIGSRGSIVPLFREQAKTGQITITDQRMTRFWITLDQGVRFVISCLQTMQGGEVFMPKLPSMRIVDLARVMAPDAEVVYTGIRSGEKLHEAMLSVDESRQAVDLGDRYALLPSHAWWPNGSYAGASLLPDGFSYASNTNDRWLSEGELREMIGE